MATWTNLPNTAVGVGGLPSGTTVTALRDNPVAIAEGATGAPRIDPINAMAHGGQLGAVGTYAFMTSTVALIAGDTVAGSSIFYSNAAGIGSTGATGTWRAMGTTVFFVGNPDEFTTLFLRIA
jgi:hypothetical protein